VAFFEKDMLPPSFLDGGIFLASGRISIDCLLRRSVQGSVILLSFFQTAAAKRFAANLSKMKA
jgi:hypothetical protein